MEIIVTTAQCCEFFDVTKVTLANWANRGCPKDGHGKWILKEVFDWYLENVQGDAENRKSLEEAKLLYWKARADREKLETDRERGAYIPRERVLRELLDRIHILKADLLAIPRVFPPHSPERGKLEKRIRHILTVYSRKSGAFRD